MGIEEIKKELQNIEQGKCRLKNKEESIMFYRSRLEYCPNKIVEDKVQTSILNNREEALVRLADFQIEYEKELEYWLTKESNIYDAINELLPEEQNIIIEKYIHGRTWSQIAKSMNYSESHIKRLGRRAIVKLKVF